MLKEGIEGMAEVLVEQNKTAQAMGSGTLPVFATPCMVALMETAACNSVQPYLDEGCTSVGTALNIKHLASTPVGMKATAKSVLTKVDGRRLEFQVEVFDEAGKIGEGDHERFVVNCEKFMAKTNSKGKN